jgi:hypothetical protein
MISFIKQCIDKCRANLASKPRVKSNSSHSSDIWYFWHIPKTAGSSLTNSLKSNFLGNLVCPAWVWSQLIKIPNNKINKYKYFGGHFYSALPQILQKKLKTVTFIREPLARALSHYNHIARTKEHYFHKTVIKLGSFESFIMDPECQPLIKNFQCKMLTSSFDPFQLAKNLNSNDIKSFRLEHMIEVMESDYNDSDLLNQAISIINEFTFVGITDRYNESIQSFSRISGFNLQYYELNKSIKMISSNDISQSVKDFFYSINQSDVKLYEYAHNKLDEFIKINNKND